MELMKNSVQNLKEYKPSKLPFKIKLDANEGRNILFKDLCKEGIKFNEDFNISFYPDNDSSLLKEEICKYLNFNKDINDNYYKDNDSSLLKEKTYKYLSSLNILAGNGSSEMIELIIKTFVDKDEIILSFVPTFSMYSVFSQIYSAKFVGVKSNEDFSVDMGILINKAKEINPKLIILCNPNNPTGYLIDKEQIKKLLESTNSIVVIDEAYMEFAKGSMVDEILKYKNLIVLRTLSKALGLAAIRLGYMISNEQMIKTINKVRAPYNLNALTQYIGVMALKNKEKILKYVGEVKTERDFLYGELNKLSIKAHKSYGNFIFFKSNIYNLKDKLADYGILIRDFSQDLKGYYRVTVGNNRENKEVIKCLKEILENEKS